jgi:hypothetical protein
MLRKATMPAVFCAALLGTAPTPSAGAWNLAGCYVSPFQHFWPCLRDEEEIRVFCGVIGGHIYECRVATTTDNLRRIRYFVQILLISLIILSDLFHALMMQSALW